MKNKTRQIIIAALLASLTCVATMIIKIPSPLNGYINPGDAIVLVTGWLMSPLYAFFAAGIGSALADAFSGYVTYIPATFIIKGLMAVIAYFIPRLFKDNKNLLPKITSSIVAEIFMVAGYFIFEGFLYGFIPSMVNILPNCVQGTLGIVLGIIIYKIFKKSNII